MTRFCSWLLSSHVMAGLSGAFSVLVLASLKRGWFNDAVVCASGLALTLFLVRKFKRMEEKGETRWISSGG